jgi:hypothetical protein
VETDSTPALYEQAIDRLACAMGGRSILPPAFQVRKDHLLDHLAMAFQNSFSLLHLQYIPSMMASYDWRVRHAGLMAIAAIGEGTGKVG